jgi:CPA2 family monovalent cation:H+ antiporter-2
VLIAQDLAVIPMMLVVHALSGHGAGGMAAVISIVAKLTLSIGFLAALIIFLSQRKRISLPMSDWIVSRPEIMPLAALAFCFTWATLSGAIGLSPAYGAFVSGLIVGNSDVRASLHRAAEPVQAVLLMAFFLSIGLLIDLHYIMGHWATVLLVLGVVTILKSVVNVGILHLLGEPWGRAFHSGVAMTQIGEFSFIICAAGLAGKALTADGYRLMIAVIALSLVISPMWLAVAKRLHAAAVARLSGVRTSSEEL